ncbi:hypothetical protein D3C71_1571030 [compost metagenome]
MNTAVSLSKLSFKPAISTASSEAAKANLVTLGYLIYSLPIISSKSSRAAPHIIVSLFGPNPLNNSSP